MNLETKSGKTALRDFVQDQVRSENEPRSLIGMPQDDWEAADIWLQTMAVKCSAVNTLDNYRRELRRLRWYCETIIPGEPTPGKWTIPDVMAYLDFLRDKSGDYLCSRLRAKPTDPDWTPFRTRLGAQARANAQKTLHALFTFWFKVGYRRGNPATPFGSGAQLVAGESPRQALPPSLLDDVLRILDENPPPKPGIEQPLQRLRNKFLILLFQHSGLRANEAVMANMGDVQRFDDPKTRRIYWSILVRHGKGGKVGRVPLPNIVMDAMREYRYAFGYKPEPDPNETTALILTPRTRRLKSIKEEVTSVARPSALTLRRRRAMRLWMEVRTRAALWRTLTKTFKYCADVLREEGKVADAELLEKASVHWLRHTYGSTLAARDVSLLVISRAMRHGDVRTTDKVYVHSDFLDIARALDQDDTRRSGDGA